MLFLCGASLVKGHLKSFCWEEAIGANTASDKGVREKEESLEAGNGEADEEEWYFSYS